MSIKLRKFFLFCSFLFSFSVVFGQLNADFTASLTSGCGSLSGVQFTATGDPSITSWSWNFGNGNVSSLRNPSANFTSPGRYIITLVVSNGTTSQTRTKTNYIQVFANPTANFTFTPTGGCSPLPVNFRSTSTPGDAPISIYNWDFGDGSPSTNVASLTHNYQVQGTFSPILQITDTNGCNSLISLGPITVTPSPVASFSTNSPRSSCNDSLTINFINGSTGINLTYLWDFGDGNTSTQENPTHTYNGYGSYNVSLTVTDPNCNNKKTELNYIRLRQPQANFSLNGSTFCKNTPLPFVNNSVDVDTYLWDFGDGTGSLSELPNKTYNDSGTYVISLTVFASGCSNSQTKTIKIETVTAAFAVDTFSCIEGDSIQFIDQSYNAAQWSWRIGKLTVDDFEYFIRDTVQNPFLRNGSKEGLFSDSLIVTSPNGCKDTIFKEKHRAFKETFVFITDDNTNAYDQFYSGCLPDTFEFNSTLIAPSQASNYTFTWTFPNSQIFVGPDPPQNLIITDDSARIVSLSVESAEGCKATDILRITLGYKIEPIVNYFPKRLCYADTLFVKDINQNDSLSNHISYIIESLSINRDRDSLAPKLIDTISTRFQDTAYYGLVDTIFTHFQDTGYYSLKIRKGYNGCDSVLFIDSAFYVKGPIIVSTDFSSDCVNRKLVNFEAEVLGITRFAWDFGDSSAFDTTNLITSHTYDSLLTQQYIFTAYNDTNGCPAVADTQDIPLIPVSPPIIRPENRRICMGDETLIWQNSLIRLDSIEWSINGQPISRKDSFNYTFDQRGVYSVGYKGKDQVGCEYNIFRDFYVSKPEASFTYNLLDTCLPTDIQIVNTTIFDTTAVHNYLLLGGTDTLFTQNSTFTYTTSGQKSITLYAENIFGCSDTVIGSNLFNLQPFDVGIRTISNRNICSGRTILFRNVSSDLNNTFFWIFGDGDTLTTNKDSTFHTFDSAGVFNIKLTGINVNGCTKIDSVLFRVEANPVAGFTADTLISSCYPLEVQFQDTSTGNIIDWYWKVGSNFSVIDTPRFIFESIGKFDVSLIVTTANGCTDSSFKSQYIQTNGPEAAFSIDKESGCVNDIFTFNLLTQKNVASYVWDFGDGNTQNGGITATHSYKKTGKVFVSLILSDASGTCNIPILDSIQISEVLADFTMTSDTGCVPFISTFTDASLGASSLSWDFGEGTNSATNQQDITYNNPGIYFIRLAITSDVGCIDTTIKQLTVFPRPTAVVSSDTGICIGQSVQLNAAGGTNYLWTPDTFINNNQIPNPIVNPDSTTRYLVNVSDPSTCYDTASIRVRVVQTPTPPILLDSTLIIGETYQLNAFAGRGFNYRWTPPEGLDCDDCPNPIATPLVNTTYYLVISDDFGCFTVRDTIDIIVEEKYSLDVPSAFSPNSDGINDLIFAKGWGLKELIAFRIYNRFGELVFESTDFNQGWDGTLRGKDQNIETYIYTVEALTFGNKVLTKTGNISLLR